MSGLPTRYRCLVIKTRLLCGASAIIITGMAVALTWAGEGVRDAANGKTTSLDTSIRTGSIAGNLVRPADFI